MNIHGCGCACACARRARVCVGCRARVRGCVHPHAAMCRVRACVRACTADKQTDRCVAFCMSTCGPIVRCFSPERCADCPRRLCLGFKIASRTCASRRGQTDLVQRGSAGRLFDLLRRRVQSAVPNIVRYGLVEQHRVLRHHSDTLPHAIDLQFAEILPINQDLALLRRIKAVQQPTNERKARERTGFQLRGGGGGVDRAPWLDPPQKELN